MRQRLIAASIALAALAVLPGAAAGAFGASLSPATLVFERAQTFHVENRSDFPITASLAIDGRGWQLADTELQMAIGEKRDVAVTAAGSDGAVIRVTVRPAAEVVATDTVAIVLEGRLRHETWLESLNPPAALLGLPLLALAVLLLYGIARRGRRAPD